ncbi:heme exporter protein CcmD [Pseudohalocynthiibacter aestuariivivens]|uniref:Heme exporter protein D n=1 Tax=Roseovarius pelagicus TaxID=2980108 RepID=A0ABY6DG25_9RHOB|nr:MULTISPECIES: heme exporter protein CcmD [Rhodobacterales]QIE45345.1 heme exporter protein CcmD [Pseudohalocynthiibacter aestuariivivens]UXX82745.1 heme exporter protein CcmD [Roseovarius pelagicus]
MIPELGKYTVAVMGSYVVSIGLLGVLVGLSLQRARRIKTQLRAVEQRIRGNG